MYCGIEENGRKREMYSQYSQYSLD
jgi:hypothetical protein